MSDAVGRFVSIAVPDLIEAGARSFASSRSTDPTTTPSQPRQSAAPGLRKPRNPNAPPGSFGKQESTVSVTNPQPAEIQASLDTALAKFVDAQPTPEKRAEVLIKLGQYKVELAKYTPMLRDADEDLAAETLETWFAYGDGELKKALVNATNGTEAFPLSKAAPAAGPEDALVKMVDAQPSEPAKGAMLQKMAYYQRQLTEMLDRGTMLKIEPDAIDAAVEDWIADGDGSHRAMKKALADAERMARAQMARSVGENETLDEKAGNAPSHVGSKLSGQNDRTYAGRSPGEGAGPRLRGSHAAPDQANGTTPHPGSGPDDTGKGGVSPAVTIRRKGTTGGLGSVAGVETPGHAQTIPNDKVIDQKTGKKKRMDKGEDLAVELVKIAPQAMIVALEALPMEAQIAQCQIAAQDAADLMAWSAQHGDALQKSELDAAITNWLAADPEMVQLKKWTAEALATAEEIPLALGKAIMSWQPRTGVVAFSRPGVVASSRPRLRGPYVSAA